MASAFKGFINLATSYFGHEVLNSILKTMKAKYESLFPNPNAINECTNK